MNIDNLMKTVEAGKPVSLKEAVLAMSKGYNDSLPSEVEISEELVILRAKLTELKGIMKDLNSGEAPEVLRKKYEDKKERNKKYLFNQILKHEEVLKLDMLISNINLFYFYTNNIDDANVWLDDKKKDIEASIILTEKQIKLKEYEKSVCKDKTAHLFSVLNELPDEQITFP